MSRNNADRDETLIKQFQSGNRSVLPELVQRWHKEFCIKAYWLTKDRELSKDITQDCWKIIIDKLKDLKDPKSFKSWAFRIVYSKSLDALRDIQRKRNELQAFAMTQTDVEEEPFDNSDLKRNLLIQINELPEPQQQVLKLFYVEDYSLKEIGELLNISVGTAKSRLFHAREKLKSSLTNRSF